MKYICKANVKHQQRALINDSVIKTWVLAFAQDCESGEKASRKKEVLTNKLLL